MGLRMSGNILKIGTKRLLLPWRKYKSEDVTTPQDVPDTVKTSYPQANILVDISPKASNAVSRYCLQAMIHDFWKLPPRNRGTLDSELRYISSKLAPETKESIEIVQKNGAIAAQFCEDVNMMVDTNVEEARLLIGLIEVLFKDWYLDRKNRELRCEELRKMADEAQKSAPTLLTKKAPARLKSPVVKKAKVSERTSKASNGTANTTNT